MDLSQKLFASGLVETAKRGEGKGECKVQSLGVSLG